MAHFQFGTDGQSSGGGGAGGNNGGGVAGFPGFGMPSQQPSIFAQNTAQPLENSQQRNIHMTSHRATTAQNTEFSMTSRSPPTNTPSSYGNFIPKRGRHGSIGGGGGSSVGSVGSLGRTSSSSLSGRLRSVSDLERMGVVTHMQKGRLKDLLINGDESLRIALEKYEAGDVSELEHLINQGRLSTSQRGGAGESAGSFDINELEGLDFGSLGNDFLSGSLGSLTNGSDHLARGIADYNGRSRANSQTGAGNAPWEAWNDIPVGGTGGVEFEMDDLGGDDATMAAYDIFPPHASTQQHTGGSLAVAAASVHGSNLGAASHPSGALSAAAAAAAAASSSSSQSGSTHNPGAASHGTRRSTSASSSSGATSSKSSGGGSSRRTGGSNQQPTITSQGTVNFPNSVSTGNKYPVSNSVAELPPLVTLPPGQAPAYEGLINFQRAKSKDAVRCVMCGKAPSDGDSGTVIPQQNKDVCRDCDKALWVHGESRTYFKWCKGCKRFRNIVAFSEKLDASKCNGCRERGRRSYLQRKGSGPEEESSNNRTGGSSSAITAVTSVYSDSIAASTSSMQQYSSQSSQGQYMMPQQHVVSQQSSSSLEM